MNVRKGTAGLLLTALALTPGFLSAGPAAAQDQTKEKHGNRKGQTMTLDQVLSVGEPAGTFAGGREESHQFHEH